MVNETSQCWRPIAIGVALWLVLAALTLLRGAEGPGSPAALNWQTEKKATYALEMIGANWAQVHISDGVMTLSGASPSPPRPARRLPPCAPPHPRNMAFPASTTRSPSRSRHQRPLRSQPTSPHPALRRPTSQRQALSRRRQPRPRNAPTTSSAPSANGKFNSPPAARRLPRNAGPLLAAIPRSRAAAKPTRSPLAATPMRAAIPAIIRF